MDFANRYLAEVYQIAFNTESMKFGTEEASFFVSLIDITLDDILSCASNTRGS